MPAARSSPLAAGLLAAALAAAPGRVEAKWLELSLGLRAGGGTGRSSAGGDVAATREDDFFKVIEGGAVGLEADLELLGVDLLVEHLQFADGTARTGSWTQLLIGLDVDPTLDGAGRWAALLGAYVGVGVGTLEPPDFPIDAAEVETKGLLARAALGLEYRPTRLVAVGLELDPGYHVLVSGGGAVNDAEEVAEGLQATALATVRLHWDTSPGGRGPSTAAAPSPPSPPSPSPSPSSSPPPRPAALPAPGRPAAPAPPATPPR